MIRFTRTAPPRVVIDEKAAEPVRFAAEELRRYLRRILGANVAENDESGMPEIRLIEAPDPYLKEEGFLISEEDDALVIKGACPRAVLYGVYEFLRQCCGCLFSGLAPDGEYIPQR